MILDCFRLAKFYGQAPGHFLALPLSELKRQLYWTSRLLDEIGDDR